MLESKMTGQLLKTPQDDDPFKIVLQIYKVYKN